MSNLNVKYQRADYSLQTLLGEIEYVWPHRQQNKGFVTGYKSASNFTGHNPDSNGIAHAYDIGVDIEGDGTGLLPKDAEWLANYLRKKKNKKFSYIIYNRRIASNATNFKWVPYKGLSPHKDHIHISVVDLYWGQPISLSPSVYDSTASWGVAKAYFGITKPVADKIQEIKEGPDMGAIKNLFKAYVGDGVDVPNNYGTKESRKKNPQWMVKNVLTPIWHDVIEAKKNSAATLALVEKMAENQGFTRAQMVEIVKEGTSSTLSSEVITVDINLPDKAQQYIADEGN